MTFATINPIEAGLSGLVGLGATLALLLMIDMLTAIHSVNDDLDQAMVIDLTTWQPQADSRMLLPVAKQQQPEFDADGGRGTGIAGPAGHICF